MLTNEERYKWNKRLITGGVLLFLFVLLFWLFGEFDNRFALLMAIASAAFIWQGYKGMQNATKQEKPEK